MEFQNLISTKIDPISEKLSCLSISQNLDNFSDVILDNQRNWWIFKIQKLKQSKLKFRAKNELQKKTIFEAFPEWKVTFEYLETQATTEQLKTFHNLAKPFFSPSKFYANDIKNCPFTTALKKKKSQFLDLLLDLDTPLYSKRLAKQVLIYGNLEIVQRFFIKTTQNLRSQDGQEWCQFACYAKDFKVFQFIFEITENPAKEYVNPERQNLYHHACHNKDPKFVQLVAENLGRTGINDCDTKGNTPLHYACKYGSKETVQFLFENHEDLALDVKILNNQLDWNLLHSACAEGSKEIVEFLLKYSPKYGIDINAMDHQGLTPFQIACSRADPMLIELFQ